MVGRGGIGVNKHITLSFSLSLVSMVRVGIEELWANGAGVILKRASKVTIIESKYDPNESTVFFM